MVAYHLLNAALYRKYLGDLDAGKIYADAYDRPTMDSRHRTAIEASPETSKLDSACLVVRDLGLMSYADALALQRQVHQQVLEGKLHQTLLLVEHDPVITVSGRPCVKQHLLADEKRLTELGIDVQPTDRGGDITYHGPGQLVAYPIIRLAPLGFNVGRYMRWLEKVVIETVATWGIDAGLDRCATGVWVGRGDGAACNSVADSQPAKLCAMGVRVRRNVTLHGLALNVTTHLEHFRTIVPCGLVGREVTSMQRLLGDRTPAMTQVKDRLAVSMRRHLEALSNPSDPINKL